MKRYLTRLLSTVLTLMLLCCSTAFAAVDADAKAAYDSLNAVSNNIADANFYYHIYMDMTDGSDTLNMDMEMNMLCKNMNQPENLQYLCNAIVSFQDMKMNMLTWYKDGYSYTDTMGSKYKTAMPLQQAMESATTGAALLNSSPDLFTDLTMRTEGDKRILSYKMDSAALNTYIQQVFNAAGMASLFSNLKITVSNITGEYVLTPDNFFSNATIGMTLEMSMDGETVTSQIYGVIELLNPGQPVEIAFPSSDGYNEI